MGTDLTPAIVAVCKERRGEGRKETGNLPGNPFWAMSLRRLGMQARLARRLICPATCVPSGRLDSDVDRDSGWFQFLFLPAASCLLLTMTRQVLSPSPGCLTGSRSAGGGLRVKFKTVITPQLSHASFLPQGTRASTFHVPLMFLV